MDRKTRNTGIVSLCFWLMTCAFINPAKAEDDAIEKPQSDKSTGKFLLRAEDQYKINNLIARIFVLTEKPYQFLGEPQVARLKMPHADQKYDYFLLLIPFNVPMIKNNLPLKYRYVRLEGVLSVFKDDVSSKADQNDNALRKKIYERFKILSIYPTNDYIKVNSQNTHELEETLDPKWNGASAGSIRNLNREVQQYDFHIATIAGITAPDAEGKMAELRWTLYPAKHQRIILGNKLGLALLAIPKTDHEDRLNIYFDGHLRYALNVTLPFMSSEYHEMWESPIREATSVEALVATHALDFPSADLGKKLIETFGSTEKDKKLAVQAAGQDRAVVFDSRTGETAEIKNGELVSLSHTVGQAWPTYAQNSAVWQLKTSYDPAKGLLSCSVAVDVPEKTTVTRSGTALAGVQGNSVAYSDFSMYAENGQELFKVPVYFASHSAKSDVHRENFLFEGFANVSPKIYNSCRTWRPN